MICFIPTDASPGFLQALEAKAGIAPWSGQEGFPSRSFKMYDSIAMSLLYTTHPELLIVSLNKLQINKSSRRGNFVCSVMTKLRLVHGTKVKGYAKVIHRNEIETCFVLFRHARTPWELLRGFCCVFNKLSFPLINLVELGSSQRSCFSHRGVFAIYTQMIRELDVSRGLCLRLANLLQVLISRAGYHFTTALSIRNLL
jgi:hypothetical protein